MNLPSPYRTLPWLLVVVGCGPRSTGESLSPADWPADVTTALWARYWMSRMWRYLADHLRP